MINIFCFLKELQDLGDIANTFPPTPELERITYYPNYPVGPRGDSHLEQMSYLLYFGWLVKSDKRLNGYWIVLIFWTETSKPKWCAPISVDNSINIYNSQSQLNLGLSTQGHWSSTASRENFILNAMHFIPSLILKKFYYHKSNCRFLLPSFRYFIWRLCKLCILRFLGS